MLDTQIIIVKGLFDGKPLEASEFKSQKPKHLVGGRGPNHKGGHYEGGAAMPTPPVAPVAVTQALTPETIKSLSDAELRAHTRKALDMDKAKPIKMALNQTMGQLKGDHPAINVFERRGLMGDMLEQGALAFPGIEPSKVASLARDLAGQDSPDERHAEAALFVLNGATSNEKAGNFFAAGREIARRERDKAARAKLEKHKEWAISVASPPRKLDFDQAIAAFRDAGKPVHWDDLASNLGVSKHELSQHLNDAGYLEGYESSKISPSDTAKNVRELGQQHEDMGAELATLRAGARKLESSCAALSDKVGHRLEHHFRGKLSGFGDGRDAALIAPKTRAQFEKSRQELEQNRERQSATLAKMNALWLGHDVEQHIFFEHIRSDKPLSDLGIVERAQKNGALFKSHRGLVAIKVPVSTSRGTSMETRWVSPQQADDAQADDAPENSSQPAPDAAPDAQTMPPQDQSQPMPPQQMQSQPMQPQPEAEPETPPILQPDAPDGAPPLQNAVDRLLDEHLGASPNSSSGGGLDHVTGGVDTPATGNGDYDQLRTVPTPKLRKKTARHLKRGEDHEFVQGAAHDVIRTFKRGLDAPALKGHLALHYGKDATKHAGRVANAAAGHSMARLKSLAQQGVIDDEQLAYLHARDPHVALANSHLSRLERRDAQGSARYANASERHTAIVQSARDASPALARAHDIYRRARRAFDALAPDERTPERRAKMSAIRQNLHREARKSGQLGRVLKSHARLAKLRGGAERASQLHGHRGASMERQHRQMLGSLAG